MPDKLRDSLTLPAFGAGGNTTRAAEQACVIGIYILNRPRFHVVGTPPASHKPKTRSKMFCRVNWCACVLRDVGVAGSNPVTPTIDFIRFFPTISPHGS